jgi:hypothetical protein
MHFFFFCFSSFLSTKHIKYFILYTWKLQTASRDQIDRMEGGGEAKSELYKYNIGLGDAS